MDEITWVDSHCHPQYDPLNLNSIQEAYDNNITKLCCVGTALNEIGFLLECKNKFNVNISLGEHPLNKNEVNWQILEENIPNLSAIGEIGFDFQSNLEEQIKIFDIQAALALKYNLPVILHIRDSSNGKIEEFTMKKLKQFPGLKGVFHCFVGSQKLAEFAIKEGFFISFSGIITFKKADALRQILTSIPKDLLLIETDSPYLAPEPKRGKTNYPVYVKYIGEFIANQLNLSYKEFSLIVSKNFDKLYNKP